MFSRLQADCTHEAMRGLIEVAMNEEFPWTGSLEEPVKDYIEIMADVKNAPPEFVLHGLLTTTAAAMGPFPEYQGPVNLFIVCIDPAGTGKTQTLKLAVHQLLGNLLGLWNKPVLVDDFTCYRISQAACCQQLLHNLGFRRSGCSAREPLQKGCRSYC